MNRNIKIALCTLALITCGFATKSTTSVYAADVMKNIGIAAPENGTITKKYVKTIVNAGVAIQPVLDKYIDQIVSIDSGAFSNCKESLDFSKAKNLQNIYSGAFFNSNVKAINLEKVPSLGVSAFSRCVSLTNVQFGNNSKLKIIPQNAFLGCYGLKSIKIPDSVEEIGQLAFANSGLRYVVLPKKVKSVNLHAFAGCADMIYASIENPNTEFKDQSVGKCFWKIHTSIYDVVDHGCRMSGYVHPKGSDLQQYMPITLFCDREDTKDDDFYPLSEIDNFKLLTSTKDGKYITLDANAKREQVNVVPDRNGTIKLGTGCSHVNLGIVRISDEVKTIKLADGVKYVTSLGYRNHKYDVIIPDGTKKMDFFDVKTAYTNDERITRWIQRINEFESLYGCNEPIEIKTIKDWHDKMLIKK